MLYKNTDINKSYIRLKQELATALNPYINVDVVQNIFVSTHPKNEINIITCGWYKENIIDYIVAEIETIFNVTLTADGGLYIQSYKNSKLYNQFYIYLLSEEGWNKLKDGVNINPNDWRLLK